MSEDNEFKVLIVADPYDTAGEARLLQASACCKRFNMDFIIAESGCGPRDLAYDLDNVQGLLLLQSSNVLRHPGVLTRLCEATCRKLPIACINLEGKGYEHSNTAALLGSLSSELSCTCRIKHREKDNRRPRHSII